MVVIFKELARPTCARDSFDLVCFDSAVLTALGAVRRTPREVEFW